MTSALSRHLGLCLATIAVSVTLSACGSSDSGSHPSPSTKSTISADDAAVMPSQPVQAGSLPKREPVDLSGLDDADRGLKVGSGHTTGGQSTTVLHVSQPFSAPDGVFPARDGDQWAGIEVRTCFTSNQNLQVDVGSYMYSLVADGIRYPGLQPNRPDWPLPQFPGFGRLAAGQCTSGWIAVPIPVGEEAPAGVQYDASGAPVAEWTF